MCRPKDKEQRELLELYGISKGNKPRTSEAYIKKRKEDLNKNQKRYYQKNREIILAKKRHQREQKNPTIKKYNKTTYKNNNHSEFTEG